MLVVDDYADTREMYAEFLSFAGFSVAEAATGEAAITEARKLKPAAVVMDLSLPGMTGWEAAAVLRRERGNALPIIAVTASLDPSFRDAALAAGCDVFLRKPVAPKTLAAEIGRLLRAAC